MRTLHDLDTPFAVVDRSRVLANVARLRERLAPHNVVLRPHVKTAKSTEVAELIFDGRPGPITVSTLAEAEAFADKGFRDITYAVGITAQKLPRIRALQERGVVVTVLLDSVEQAEAVAGIPALIEVDCDGHRGGVSATGDELAQIGQVLTESGSLAGILLHAGESYFAYTPQELKAAAVNEADVARRAATTLRQAGLDVPTVSIGSTPTAHAFTTDIDLSGITEVRAGNYVFFDLVMAGIGVCTVDDLALSVVVTVIGHQTSRGQILTDGGWMATSRDRGTARQPIDQGYGLVAELDGTLIPDLLMSDASQEHGTLSLRPGSPYPLPNLPIGTRLRILPNHACATAAQHRQYTVISSQADLVVENVWERIQGW
ncbi:alanine racemase [Kineosporia babensis]|uniref:Alanine racemase n=1 Tax=Kineosporia babensis TaxID=499548 RepID=A0A9X1NIP2_9ACTN|nr:alanine racemase [Kineosporia babensis]MCD5314476.1 alanine racemase [Kineosporia babensis]